MKDVVTTQLSRINFVDLAGSEALSYEFGTKQQEETKSINLSLLALRHVITSLATKESFIPYRESVLTRLLAPSLSMNSVTAILCTVNANEKHLAMTQGTLRFGNVSQSIVQKAQMNEFIRGKDGGVVYKDKIVETTLQIEDAKKMKVPKEYRPATITSMHVPTRQGNVHAWQAVPEDGSFNRYALCIHAFGTGCSGEDWSGVFNGLCHQGYKCLSLDMPGFGKTPGPRQTSRTERFDEAGGPMEIIYDAIDYLTEKVKSRKVIIVGWDWGAGMGMYACLGGYKNRVSALALYHPSWTDKIDLLHSIAQPVLLCWVPTDQLHLYSTGKRMAKVIPKSKLASLVLKAGKERNSEDVFSVLETTIVDWVEEIDKKIAGPKKVIRKPTPPPEPKPVVTPPPEGDDGASSDISDSESDDDDEDGSLSTQSSFLACLLSDPMAAAAAVTRGPMSRREAKKKVLPASFATSVPSDEDVPFAAFRSLVVAKDATQLRQLQDALLGRNDQGGNRPIALRICGALPTISPHTSWKDFTKSKIWNLDSQAFVAGALDFFEMRNTFARYPPGRRVFVKCANVCTDFLSPGFGGYVPDGSTFFTFKARISPKSTSSECVVILPDATGGSNHSEKTVKWSHVLEWNEGTRFPPGSQPSTIAFEDAIMCRYHGVITRAKVAQCAISIEPILHDLYHAYREWVSSRTTAAGEEVLRLQVKAVRKLWTCIDMIHHVQMGKDPKRLCVPDCGRLATYGQWHCHGMASVFAAFLLPFSRAIGLDVRYRDGFFMNGYSRDCADSCWNRVPRQSADHTWLEVTFFPSCVTYCCDPSFVNDEGILCDLDWAYSGSGHRFPVRNLTSSLPTERLPIDQSIFIDDGSQSALHVQESVILER